MTVELDGRLMFDRKAAHDCLQRALALPDYYGRNLDALYDLLTDRAAETTIRLRYREMMEHQLGDYSDALVATLEDAAEENPAIRLIIEA